MPDPNSGVREDIDVKGKDLTPAADPGGDSGDDPGETPAMRRLVQYLGAIVANVTTAPVQSSCAVDLKSRRRPDRQSCCVTERQ
jgi:hypothetical protein